MPKNVALYLTTILLTIMPLCTAIASTEIYKWVDANGTVHFGDKPQDPAQADTAKPVELTTGYQPPARTPEEQKALENEQRLIQEKSRAYQDRQRQQRQQQQEEKEAQAKVRQEKAALCAAYEHDIQSITTTEIVNGRRHRTYLSEDGKSVTVKRQQEIAEELRVEMRAADC